MKRIGVGLMLLGFLIVMVVWLLMEYSQPESQPEPPLEPVATVLPKTSNTPSTNQLPEGWSVYQSEAGWRLNYPEEIEVREPEEGGVNFNYLGETQSLGTELFDGYSININMGDLGTSSLEELVERERQEMIEEPAVMEVSETEEKMVAGFEGYEFEVRSLGDYRHLYLLVGDGEYLEISYLVADPQGLGYEETVAMMFESINVGGGEVEEATQAGEIRN